MPNFSHWIAGLWSRIGRIAISSSVTSRKRFSWRAMTRPWFTSEPPIASNTLDSTALGKRSRLSKSAFIESFSLCWAFDSMGTTSVAALWHVLRSLEDTGCDFAVLHGADALEDGLIES